MATFPFSLQFLSPQDHQHSNIFQPTPLLNTGNLEPSQPSPYLLNGGFLNFVWMGIPTIYDSRHKSFSSQQMNIQTIPIQSTPPFKKIKLEKFPGEPSIQSYKVDPYQL